MDLQDQCHPNPPQIHKQTQHVVHHNSAEAHSTTPIVEELHRNHITAEPTWMIESRIDEEAEEQPNTNKIQSLQSQNQNGIGIIDEAQPINSQQHFHKSEPAHNQLRAESIDRPITVISQEQLKLQLDNNQINLFPIRSQPAIKQEKSKKRKIRQYIVDFTDFLPDSLLLINRTNIQAKIRVGCRYQADIQPFPPLKTLVKPMDDWAIWMGSSFPERRPSQQWMQKFRQLLGENRNYEELISMRERMACESWRELLEYLNKNKTDLRKVFHMTQRNRL